MPSFLLKENNLMVKQIISKELRDKMKNYLLGEIVLGKTPALTNQIILNYMKTIPDVTLIHYCLENGFNATPNSVPPAEAEELAKKKRDRNEYYRQYRKKHKRKYIKKKLKLSPQVEKLITSEEKPK